MEEMTIQEKARRYDEALEKSKRLYEQGTITESLCYVFPELAESEDERIRKTLVAFFTDWHKTRSHCWGISVPKILAWLEKQGEQIDLVNKEYWRGYREGKQEILDKYSEQKPTDKDEPIEWPGKIKTRKVKGVLKEMLDEKLKSADKVEPKFKVGDNIISTLSNNPYYITEVCNGYYLTDIGCIIMFNAQDNFELVEQKPTWSEEDTERYISCLQHLGTGDLEQPETINSKWFKEHIKIPAQVQRVIAL